MKKIEEKERKWIEKGNWNKEKKTLRKWKEKMKERKLRSSNKMSVRNAKKSP